MSISKFLEEARLWMLTGGHAAQHAGMGVPKKLPLVQRPTTLSTDAPTITYSATAPASGRAMPPQLPNVRPAGCAVAYNSASTLYDLSGKNGFVGIDTILIGDTITLGWKCDASTAERFMFFVDGYPVSLTPATPSVSTSSGSQYYVTLVFGSYGKRRVEILGTNIAAFVRVVVPYSASVAPGPRRRTVHITGDSFNGGSLAITSTPQLPGAQFALKYDASVSVDGLGGTGYVKTNGASPVFGDAARVAIASAVQPDDIVFMGSINDDDQTGIQSAASSCWAAYRVAAPTANFIIFGPQGTNATDTLSANRKANCLAVLAATQAAGFAYNDLCGWLSSASLRAFATFTFFNPGELVTYLGSIWRHDATVSTQYPGTGAPGQPGYQAWTLLTADLFGTGKVGSTTGDGSRDTLVYSDNIHPPPNRCLMLAERMAQAVSLATR